MVLDRSRGDMWWRFAALIQLGLHGLFRPTEITDLLRSDLKLPFAYGLSPTDTLVAAIRQPKNRAFMGRQQVRIVRDGAVTAWVTWLCDGMEQSEPVWPYSKYQFRQCFAAAGIFFGLEQALITPASLRAGGATFLLESGTPVATIRFLGAWASEKSLASYLQEAECASVLMSLAPRQVRRIRNFLVRLQPCLLPPAMPAEWVLAAWSRTTCRPC